MDLPIENEPQTHFVSMYIVDRGEKLYLHRFLMKESYDPNEFYWKFIWSSHIQNKLDITLHQGKEIIRHLNERNNNDFIYELNDLHAINNDPYFDIII